MSAEGEASEVARSTSVVADDHRPPSLEHTQTPVTCRNCGAIVTSKFCGECSQPAHIHRSLGALAHDILHSVFHLEGKFLRTLPLLILRPGSLTYRYVHGERAKFVSPLALFLTAVFVMFAVFSLLSWVDPTDTTVTGHSEAIATTERSIAELRSRLADPALTAEQRATIESEIADLEFVRSFTQVFSPDRTPRNGSGTSQEQESSNRLLQFLEKVNANRDLLLYKLKTNGYKFSWMLIPMSIPFMWLMFVRRRDVALYDHAIFVTHSISFMMLFAVVVAVASAIGVTSDILEMLVLAVPPVHMYVHLRGAYGLSRTGALVRLFFLLVFALLILISFTVILFLLGMPS